MFGYLFVEQELYGQFWFIDRHVIDMSVVTEFHNINARCVSSNPWLAGWINIIVLFPLLLIFSEITPKTMAVTNTYKIASDVVATPILLAEVSDHVDPGAAERIIIDNLLDSKDIVICL